MLRPAPRRLRQRASPGRPPWPAGDGRRPWPPSSSRPATMRPEVGVRSSQKACSGGAAWTPRSGSQDQLRRTKDVHDRSRSLRFDHPSDQRLAEVDHGPARHRRPPPGVSGAPRDLAHAARSAATRGRGAPRRAAADAGPRLLLRGAAHRRHADPRSPPRRILAPVRAPSAAIRRPMSRRWRRRCSPRLPRASIRAQ